MTFVKGKSGNPHGRPVGSKCHLSKELEKIVSANGGKVARQIVETLVDMTLKRDAQAGRILWERLEGRVSTLEELDKRAGVTEAKMAPEQRKQKLLELLRSPEIRSLVEEAVQPATERLQ